MLPGGTARWLGIVSGAWAIGAPPTCARGISEDDFNFLRACLAQTNGSLRGPVGDSFWLAASGSSMAAMVPG